MNKKSSACSRLVDTLRAEAKGNDLSEDDQGNLRVLAETKDGKFYKLGHVSADLVYQSPRVAKAAIERIKFHKTLKI